MDKYDLKCDYLKKHLYVGLQNLNENGLFDAPSIYYFNLNDFKVILTRLKKLKIGVFGIEPWKDNMFYDVKVFEDYTDDCYDIEWCWRVINNYSCDGLQFSASYSVSEEVLKFHSINYY
ncbi:hypothetical protein H7F37_03040 [Winogradskyella sp. PAMC22761]|nr:hypothetical protein H7F37_03040 [Winogradskyella sp. PAMC22761]